MIHIPYEEHTRVLTQDDIGELYEILVRHQTVGKMPFTSTYEEFSEKILNSLSTPNFRMIGYYEDGRLTTFLFQNIGVKIPAWHMTLLSTISKHRWNYSLNGLDYCWANAMAYAEQMKIYRLYWSLPEKWANTQDKTIHTSLVWQRYDIYKEATIDAGDYPTWVEYAPAFGPSPRNHKSVIKMGILKNEYRESY